MVVVDLDNGQILKAPHDGCIFKVEKQGTEAVFFMKADKQDTNRVYGAFKLDYTDFTGKKFNGGKMSVSTGFYSRNKN